MIQEEDFEKLVVNAFGAMVEKSSHSFKQSSFNGASFKERHGAREMLTGGSAVIQSDITKDAEADRVASVGNPSSVLSQVEATSTGTTKFRRRRLSKENIGIANGASLASIAGGEVTSPEPLQQEEAPPMSLRSAMAATAATAATRAAMANGKVLLVAREMEETPEHEGSEGSTSPSRRRPGSSASFTNRRDGLSSALSSLTSGQIVGTFSCHGAEPSDEHEGSIAKINQDCACIAHPVNGDHGAALFCVYDGHGDQGMEVSLQVLQSIRHALADEEGAKMLTFGQSAAAAAAFGAGTVSLRSDPKESLIAAFEAVQAQLEACAEEETPLVDARDSGACATVAYLRDHTLWIAGAGDCSAVLGTCQQGNAQGGAITAKRLSTDHKCDLDSERKRIESMGGYVRPAMYDDDGDLVAPARLFEDIYDRKKGPGLAISRGIGDLKAMRCGYIATPEVQKHRIDPAKDRILILASDGVWEFLSPQEALDLVAPFYLAGRRAFDACKWLIANAAAQWKLNEGDYRDDITAIVLWLPAISASLAKETDNKDQESSGGSLVEKERKRMSLAFS